MGRYLVLACRRCRRARIAEAHRKTTSCPTCNKSLAVEPRRALYATDDAADARAALGRVNARLAGRADEFAEAGPGAADGGAVTKPVQTALAAASGNRALERLEEVARGLGEFDRATLAAALADHDLKVRVDEALRRLVARDVVYEPTPGTYRVL